MNPMNGEPNRRNELVKEKDYVAGQLAQSNPLAPHVSNYVHHLNPR
jgi:hypothetical protein